MTDLQEPRPHRPRVSSLGVIDDLARLLAEGRRVAVATVVRARGSHPRAVGAKMLVTDDGRVLHTIGGGPLEASVIADCREALAGVGEHAEGGAGGRSSEPGLRRYDLSEAGERSVGMTCGGSVEIFIDVEEPPQRLVIFGAGHVGRAVARAASVAGFAPLVVDDRAEWLAADAFPAGTALHRCSRDYSSDLPDTEPTDCVVVMTRCHETDMTVLGRLAGRDVADTPAGRGLAERDGQRHAYVGFMGSRRKVARAFRRLEAAGVSRDWLATVHAPVGLAIGAETPGEIAIAVVAEIVAVLRGASIGESMAAAGASTARGSGT